MRPASNAALNLQKLKIKPLIICKGLVGKSGASLFAGNLVISGRLLGNSEAQARNTAEFLIKYHNQFLIDQNWARRCGAWIEQVYLPGARRARSLFPPRRCRQRRDQPWRDPEAWRRTCKEILACRSWICGESRSSVRVFRSWRILAATALLRNDDGSIGGVFCLNYMTGEYVAVQARAVVLATGYSDRLHQRSTGTRNFVIFIATASGLDSDAREYGNAMVAYQRHR